MSKSSDKESRIPVGTQFSPGVIFLPGFLAAIVEHSGDLESLREAIWEPEVRISPPTKSPTRRQRNLPLESAAQYGLLTAGTYEATPLAQELAGLQPPEVYERFARHILLRCGGLRVVEAVQQMQADGLRVTGDALAEFLTSQGFRVTVHNTAINTLRMWLAEAGVFPMGRSRVWTVNEGAKRRLVNLDDTQIAILAGLTEAQAAFVEGLCVLEPKDWTPATAIRDWAEGCRGVRFGRASLPNEVLKVLKSAGLIEYRTGGTGGGKTSLLRTTERFDREVLGPFVRHATKDLDAALSAYYRKRPEDIFAELESLDRHIKGQALEAFVIFVMRLLGLRFVGWRKRAEAEVDALLEGVLGPVATRWQVQCKNTPKTSVRLEDVAKEVGLLPITGATHLLFVANSRFSDQAVAYAHSVMERAGVGIYLLDKDAFDALRSDPASIARLLGDQAEGMLRAARPPLYDG